MDSTEDKYKIGYINPKNNTSRLKQGLPLQNISSSCVSYPDGKCDRARMYPITPHYPGVNGCSTEISYNKCL